jgi:hypothetical protein
MNLSPELYNASQANLSVQPYVPVKNASVPYPVNSFPRPSQRYSGIA